MDTKLNRTIRSYFAKRKEVVAVYLFGSYATGKETGSSDVDIAVLVDRAKVSPELTSQYTAELSKLTRKDIHLTLLNFAPERLAGQIYRKGHLLLTTNPRLLALFNMTMFSRIADFSYYRDRTQKGLVRKINMEGKQIG